MRSKSGLPSPASDYLTKPPTKAPSWHGLVVFDVWFNNLTAGLFLVAALSQLIAPEPFSNVTRVAFPLAFLLLIVDLVLLVLDLGDPWRFHHMLRVFKPSSPMSLGTWCLTAYSLPLAIAALLALLGIQPGWFEALVLITGILPALGTAIYKGVLFSTSSQPGWKDARWLGSYLTSSAFLLGSALFVVLAIWMKQDRAIEILRPALVGLLLLNGVTIGLLLVGLRDSFGQFDLRSKHWLIGLTTFIGGYFMPLVLIAMVGTSTLLAAACLIIFAALILRYQLIQLPEAAAHRQGGAAVDPSQDSDRPTGRLA